ncbi:hypothetical protein [Priestia aryabhattai]
MELNEKELVFLLNTLKVSIAESGDILNVRQHFTEEFKEEMLPKVDQMLAEENTYKHETVASLYVKAAEEYIKYSSGEKEGTDKVVSKK